MDDTVDKTIQHFKHKFLARAVLITYELCTVNQLWTMSTWSQGLEEKHKYGLTII